MGEEEKYLGDSWKVVISLSVAALFLGALICFGILVLIANYG